MTNDGSNQTWNISNVQGEKFGIGHNTVITSYEVAGEETIDPEVDATSDKARIYTRLGFTFDVVGFSRRSNPQQITIQALLVSLASDAVEALGMDLAAVDLQKAGDGLTVFLTEEVELHRALPKLLRALRESLSAGNRKYVDKIRLRLAVGNGPVGRAPAGWAESTVIELHRLVDSSVLRQAMVDHPDAELVALVTNELYRHTVGAGHPGLSTDEFEAIDVAVEDKDFLAHAWLWVPRA